MFCKIYYSTRLGGVRSNYTSELTWASYLWKALGTYYCICYVIVYHSGSQTFCFQASFTVLKLLRTQRAFVCMVYSYWSLLYGKLYLYINNIYLLYPLQLIIINHYLLTSSNLHKFSKQKFGEKIGILIFVTVFVIWLNRRQLDFYICLCLWSLEISHIG